MVPTDSARQFSNHDLTSFTSSSAFIQCFYTRQVATADKNKCSVDTHSGQCGPNKLPSHISSLQTQSKRLPECCAGFLETLSLDNPPSWQGSKGTWVRTFFHANHINVRLYSINTVETKRAMLIHNCDPSYITLPITKKESTTRDCSLIYDNCVLNSPWSCYFRCLTDKIQHLFY